MRSLTAKRARGVLCRGVVIAWQPIWQRLPACEQHPSRIEKCTVRSEKILTLRLLSHFFLSTLSANCSSQREHFSHIRNGSSNQGIRSRSCSAATEIGPGVAPGMSRNTAEQRRSGRSCSCSFADIISICVCEWGFCASRLYILLAQTSFCNTSCDSFSL